LCMMPRPGLMYVGCRSGSSGLLALVVFFLFSCCSLSILPSLICSLLVSMCQSNQYLNNSVSMPGFTAASSRLTAKKALTSSRPRSCSSLSCIIGRCLSAAAEAAASLRYVAQPSSSAPLRCGSILLQKCKTVLTKLKAELKADLEF